MGPSQRSTDRYSDAIKVPDESIKASTPAERSCDLVSGDHPLGFNISSSFAASEKSII